MYSSLYGERRVLSAPFDIHFAGFSSTTTELQRAGWILAAEEDPLRGSVRLLMKLPSTSVHLMAESASNFHDFTSRGAPPPVFVVKRAFADATIQLMVPSFNFKPIDAEPQYCAEPKSLRLKDLSLFATPLVRTEEIIVEPQSVAECLDLIRKMQAPELDAVRRRNARRDNEPMAQTNFHAQILSFAA